MQTLIEGLRQIIGNPDFYIDNGNYNSTWDYGAFVEYMVAAVILIVVIISAFKFLRALVG